MIFLLLRQPMQQETDNVAGDVFRISSRGWGVKS